MKYSAFEQAALEAKAGLQEIDAQIERLQAKRDMLEMLQRSARQLLAEEPIRPETFSAAEDDQAYRSFEAPAFVPTAPERNSSSQAKEEWSAFVRNSAAGSAKQ